MRCHDARRGIGSTGALEVPEPFQVDGGLPRMWTRLNEMYRNTFHCQTTSPANASTKRKARGLTTARSLYPPHEPPHLYKCGGSEGGLTTARQCASANCRAQPGSSAWDSPSRAMTSDALEDAFTGVADHECRRQERDSPRKKPPNVQTSNRQDAPCVQADFRTPNDQVEAPGDCKWAPGGGGMDGRGRWVGTLLIGSQNYRPPKNSAHDEPQICYTSLRLSRKEGLRDIAG